LEKYLPRSDPQIALEMRAVSQEEGNILGAGNGNQVFSFFS
jgi:hypothetical protein